jgi:predicted ester cyclase
VATLAGFPDRRLFADEVIWSGDDKTHFYTSHRITHVGRNTGYSGFGPPTGRHVRYNAIADCVIRENRIVEEWLVRDNVTQVRQLGFDPLVLARELAEREATAGISFENPGEIERVAGQNTPLELPPAPDEFEIEDFIHRSIHQIWNWRLFNVIDGVYAPTYTGKLPSGRHLYGRGDYKAFVLALLAAFPDAMMQIDHFCALADGPETYRTAIRWTLQGTHLGPGIYGKPSGKRVSILGMSHHLVSNGQIVQEWTVFDEFALLKQIFRIEYEE